MGVAVVASVALEKIDVCLCPCCGGGAAVAITAAAVAAVITAVQGVALGKISGQLTRALAGL